MSDAPMDAPMIAKYYRAAMAYFLDNEDVTQVNCPLTILDAVKAVLPEQPSHDYFLLMLELLGSSIRPFDVPSPAHATFAENQQALIVAYIAEIGVDDAELQAETEKRISAYSSLRNVYGPE